MVAHALALAAHAQLLVPPSRMIPRDYDVVTRENHSLNKVFSIPSFPVYMGVAPANHPQRDDILADLTWHISSDSGMVQLHPLAPLEYVYLQQHNAVVGTTWRQHHDAFAAVLAKQQPRHVLEIGGGHGYLAMKLLFTQSVGEWTMVDPNPLAIFQMPGITIVKQYIEQMETLPPGVDTVVHSHTLEHIYDPALFFSKLRDLMSIGSQHIFSVPNIVELARHDQPCLHFEHTLLLREEWVDWLLNRYGFEILGKEPFGGVHSLFYTTKLVRKEEPAELAALPNFFRDNNKVIRGWYNRFVDDAQAAAAALSVNRSLNFLFAAHSGSQLLLALGLPAERLSGILDNNPDKVGQRLYGSPLWVHRPSVIRGLPSPRIVLRQGTYNVEIAAQLSAINPTCIFIGQSLPQAQALSQEHGGGNGKRANRGAKAST